MRKFISLILVIVMIFSAVACVDLSVFATDISVNNRAQWLSKLTETFDMTVDEDNYPDNYFSDISSDSEYYRDIMVATEFGLVDVEAGGEVDPEGEITREFASHTLNICLGWSLEGQAGDNGEYTFADFEDCIYPDDDQVAVNRAWFALDDSENFLPEQEATAAEIKNMLDDAQATLAEDEVDENYENTFEYKDGVVEIADGTKVEFYDKSIKIFNTDYTIHENDTVVVYSNGIPVIYNAKKVTVDSNCITVQTTEEQTEEAVENVDMQTSFDVDATDFIPGEGFEVVDESSASISSKSSAKGKKPKNSITLSTEIPLLAGNKITLNIAIKNIKFSSKENTEKQTVSAKLTFDVSYSIGAEFNFTDIDPDSLDDLNSLGTIPIAGIGFVEFKPELNFNGKTSFEQTYNVVVGFSRDSSGTHNISSFHKGNFTFVFEGSCKFGIKVEVGVTIVVVKAGVYGEIGLIAKAQAKRTVDTNGNNLFCISLGGYLYLTVGVEIVVDVKVWKFTSKVEWEIFKEDNSPLRLYFHIENGKVVNKCTADSTQYVTPIDSKYGRAAADENGNYDFYETSGNYYYYLNGDKATITGYSGTAANLMIPGYIDGHLVIAIGKKAFDECKTIKKVIIPNSVKSIGEYAFYDCSGLKSITIGNSVTSIGSSAFNSCYSLTNVTIGNSVTSIGSSAFSSCYYLTNVTIGNSVTSIGEYAFSGCSILTDVYYTGSQQQWNNIVIADYNDSLKNATIHYNYSPNHIHSYTDVVTPPTCTAKGFTTHTCACGDSYKDTYVNALGHKWDSGKVTKKATPTATGIKTYTCKVCKAKKTSTIAKCAKYANTLTVKGKKVNASFAKLKKANLSIAKNSVLTISKAQGKLTYAKTSGNKSISINKTKGTIQIKKGIKKGTYKIGVKVTAAGNATYKSASKTATITVVVK